MPVKQKTQVKVAKKEVENEIYKNRTHFSLGKGLTLGDYYTLECRILW